jgi:hypothetical protein
VNLKVLPEPFITKHRLFKPGDLLIYYNWRGGGHQRHSDQNWFNQLSHEQHLDLRVDDQVWIEGELDPGGKVYGYRLIEITDLELLSDRMRLTYVGGGSSGCFSVILDPKKFETSVAQLTNENAVYSWTYNNYFSRNVR